MVVDGGLYLSWAWLVLYVFNGCRWLHEHWLVQPVWIKLDVHGLCKRQVLRCQLST